MTEPTNVVNPGKVHADLMGALGAHRFRPERLELSRLGDAVAATFELDGKRWGPMLIADVSQTGLGLLPADVEIAPGSVLSDMRITHQGEVVWQGTAVCIYQVDTPKPRIGVRFSSELFDLAKLQVKASEVTRSVNAELEQQEQFATWLPAEWIARVTRVRVMLEGTKQVLDRIEREMSSSSSDDTSIRLMNVEAILQDVYRQVGPRYMSLMKELYRTSLSFGRDAREVARAYATRELLPSLYPCPMHSRAYSKPRGYAGDYRLMTLYFKQAHEGPSLYARFLHLLSQNYSLGHTVISREKFMRETLAQTIAQSPSPRIVSLACGPALEVKHWLMESTTDKPTKLIFIDQDEEALKYLTQGLNQELVKKKPAPPIDVHPVNFSVKQLLKPADPSEQKHIGELLHDVDLIYTMGLYDYLPRHVGQSLTKRLYSFLRPGGRLLIGNLAVTPDTTWIMEYVLSWHLEYRDDAQMLDLASTIDEKPREVSVKRDSTGNCLFLDVRKP